MRVILVGASGHMGRILQDRIRMDPDFEIAALVNASGSDGCQTFAEISDVEADCIIDFSNHASTMPLLDFAVKHQLPSVIATTGQTDEERKAIRDASRHIPIFFSANMSPAIAQLANMAAQVLKMFPDADVEIVEIHHNRKVDVPSGTALTLARALQAVRPDSELAIGRHENGRRKPKEIGIHSLRMGNQVGTHEIIFSTGTQTITLKHETEDRAVFAEGALTAAKFIVKQKSGLYEMQDMILQNGGQ